MKYTLHENLSAKKGVISNTHGFLNRGLDAGFKTKWSGYWVPPYKFLDYLSFKINGVWLDSGTLQATEYGEKMVFHHETDSLRIHETIDTPEKFPGFKVKLRVENKTDEKKAMHAVLEPGVDIRPKSMDVSTENYDIQRQNERITLSRMGKKLVIEPENPSGFSGDRCTKEHFPGERQKCKIPEKPVFKREIEGRKTSELEIDFRTSQATFSQIDSNSNRLEHDIGRCFGSSIESLENLFYSHNGSGIIAGHPWFQNYWARDSFWTVLGLIDAGYFRMSADILKNFADQKLAGKISPEDSSDNERSLRADTEPLFIIASEKLRLHDGISGKIRRAREEAVSRLEMEQNIVNHSPEGTWMDTLERENAVDIQSLWLEAAKIMGDERSGKLKEGLRKFEREGELQDQLNGANQMINTAIPLMFGHLDGEIARKELEKINGEFCSRYGARTKSVADPDYDSSGYHTGSVWGLTTCWAAAANFKNGKPQEGTNFLKKMNQLLDRNQPGALPEVVDAESGKLLGASEQAWSAGMLVHVVDSYMLGIDVKENSVSINPADNLSCERKGKKIRGEKVDMKIRDGDVEILNDPDLSLRL